MKDSENEPCWGTRGKTINQLIQELQSFENQDMLVEISVDDGSKQKAHKSCEEKRKYLPVSKL